MVECTCSEAWVKKMSDVTRAVLYIRQVSIAKERMDDRLTSNSLKFQVIYGCLGHLWHVGPERYDSLFAAKSENRQYDWLTIDVLRAKTSLI